LSVLLVASLAVLALAALGSLALMLRTGETRVALLLGLFLLLGLQQGVALYERAGTPLAFDLATAWALAGLGIGLLGLLSVFALARTLDELERAEALHWESMEGVRGLTDLASRREMSLDERLPFLLELGCERLGMQIGVVSRVRGERYEVLAIHAPESFPIGPGAVFDLADTFCSTTITNERPVAVNRASDVHWLATPTRNPFRFEAYLGCPIRVRGEPLGTLAFASLEPHGERFTASHKDLLVLMAQWIGAEQERSELAAAEQEQSELAEAELERRADAEQELDRNRREAEQELDRRRRAAEQELERSRQAADRELEDSRLEANRERERSRREAERSRQEANRELERNRREAEDSRREAELALEQSRREARLELERSRQESAQRVAPVAAAIQRARRRLTLSGRRTLDLNTTVSRLEKRIRRLLPAGVSLELQPDPDLAKLPLQRIPVDAIVTSLVHKATEAMPSGGRVTISTANHETTGGDPGVMQAVPPARYVTLTVAESSGAVDADALARVFDAPEPEPTRGADAEGELALGTVYRLLQRAGGDLSVEIEPGRGSRFVVFLPLPGEKTHDSVDPVRAEGAGETAEAPQAGGPAAPAEAPKTEASGKTSGAAPAEEPNPTSAGQPDSAGQPTSAGPPGSAAAASVSRH